MRRLSHAVAVRTVRTRADLRHALRDPGDRSLHRRPRGHGLRYRRGPGERHRVRVPLLRPPVAHEDDPACDALPGRHAGPLANDAGQRDDPGPVSYTHLTLPTI